MREPARPALPRPQITAEAGGRLPPNYSQIAHICVSRRRQLPGHTWVLLLTLHSRSRTANTTSFGRSLRPTGQAAASASPRTADRMTRSADAALQRERFVRPAGVAELYTRMAARIPDPREGAARIDQHSECIMHALTLESAIASVTSGSHRRATGYPTSAAHHNTGFHLGEAGRRRQE